MNNAGWPKTQFVIKTYNHQQTYHVPTFISHRSLVAAETFLPPCGNFKVEQVYEE